jgi:hypothetical protein
MADKTVKAKHDHSKTMDIAEAGRKYFGIGRSASYAAAKSGDIPSKRIGGKIVALIPAIERMLELGSTIGKDDA